MIPRPLTGRLLVSTPMLLDPNFHRTVILVLDHGDQGALGVVLNRASDTAADDLIPGAGHAIAEPDVVFEGGPVEPDALVVLGGSLLAVAEGAGWRHVLDGVGILDVDAAPRDLPLEHLRLFAGYAGWATGQLELEVAMGSWFVVDADPDDPFTSYPDHLWHTVLAREGGDFEVFAAFPLDLSLN